MSDSAVTSAGLIADLEPYVVLAIGAIVTALGTFIATQIQKRTGIAVSAATTAKVEKYIADKAAQAVASAADNLAHEKINVGSPIVADLTNKIVASLPGELNSIGLSPDAVAHKLTAEFGRLQAQMTVTPIPPKKEDQA